jgi:hypothetical protein
MYDDITTTILFPSVELAKYSQLWQTFERKALADKESHNFYENKICSKDGPLDDWWYGDVMEGKFSMEIKRYKVDKRVN